MVRRVIAMQARAMSMKKAIIAFMRNGWARQ
jgi:hypothetical protein